jgi:hypothetical protein
VHLAGPGRDDSQSKLLCDDRWTTDGSRASGCQHSVQHSHADGSLGLLLKRLNLFPDGHSGRGVQFVVSIHARWSDPLIDQECIAWARDLSDALAPYAVGTVRMGCTTTGCQTSSDDTTQIIFSA